jgi:hypothetical protein
MFEEPAMGAGHVVAHVLDEAMRRSDWGWAPWLCSLLASGSVLDAEDYIEELDDGALRVTATAELHIRLLASAIVEHDSVWKSGISHILASREEWPDSVIEYVRIATLIHALKE